MADLQSVAIRGRSTQPRRNQIILLPMHFMFSDRSQNSEDQRSLRPHRIWQDGFTDASDDYRDAEQSKLRT
jgi:hypothetical protein